MNIDNITSKGITLNENGKLMQIEIYEKQIQELTNNWNELEEYLNNEIDEWQDVSDDWTKAQVQEDKIILDKMKQIKENNK